MCTHASIAFCAIFSCLGQHTEFAVHMAKHNMPGFLQAAGEQTTFMIVAKDANGVQKSLGGDKFAVSWCHNGTKACTTGKPICELCVHPVLTCSEDLSCQHYNGNRGCWSPEQTS